MSQSSNLGGNNGTMEDNTERDVNKGNFKRQIDGVDLMVTEPENTPIRLTFLITESNQSENSYKTIRETLLSLNHVVVVLAFRPWKMKEHDLLAHLIHSSFHNVLKDDFRIRSYGIIGHGIGGKIALLVPSLHPRSKSLKVVMALDPIDESPTMFTSPESNKNYSFPSENLSQTKFFVTSTNNGASSNKHNGVAICRRNRGPHVKFIDHDGADHLSAYCDREVSSFLCHCHSDGNKKRNENTFRRTMKLIKTNFYWTEPEEENKNEEENKKKDDDKNIRGSKKLRFSLFENNSEENGKKKTDRKVSFLADPNVKIFSTDKEEEEEEEEEHRMHDKAELIIEMESRTYDQNGHLVETKHHRKRSFLKRGWKKLKKVL